MGCSGRMGKAVTRQVLNSDKFEFIGGAVRADSEDVGKDMGRLLHREPIGVIVSNDAEPVIKQADVVIDFTVPLATSEHALFAAKYKKPYVTGTTGLNKDLREDIVNASYEIPVVFSPNMSIGITMLTTLVEKVAKVLDDSFDIEILEMHHRHKLDAPSGTSIAIGQAAAKGRGVILESNQTRCRTTKRNPGEIGFAVLRGGEVTGDHTAIFAGSHEILELKHKALDRSVYASGALKAAEWVIKQPPGLYTMHDVLGLRGV